MRTPEERARLQQEILWLVAEGTTATAACRRLSLPISTLQDWKRHDPEFMKEWRLARVEQAHCLADEIIDIADEPVAPGDMAAVQRNRLRVDTRKWFCGKTAPRCYGDKLAVNVETEQRSGVIVLPALDDSSVTAPVRVIAAPTPTARPLIRQPGETIIG